MNVQFVLNVSMIEADYGDIKKMYSNGHFGRSKCAVTIPTKDR